MVVILFLPRLPAVLSIMHIFLVYMHEVCVGTCAVVHVGGGGTHAVLHVCEVCVIYVFGSENNFCGVTSLQLSLGFWGSNSGQQA